MGLSMLALLGVATAPTALAKTSHAKVAKVKVEDPTIYDSTVGPTPGSLDSLSFAAGPYDLSEFGNQIAFGGTARVLDNVTVQLDSWGCESGQWTGTFAYAPSSTPQTDPCVSSAGSTFTEPVTLNVYNVGPNNAVGSLITTNTQTFAIPYRPSADPNFASDCVPTSTQYNIPISALNGTWFDPNRSPVTDQPIGCLNGFLDNVSFNFGHVALPDKVIYGIAYNTTNWGYQPYGPTACSSTQQGCGYDSLNVGLSNEPVSPNPGSDPNQGAVYLNTGDPGFCDGGPAGVLRIDGGTSSNCWTTDGNVDPSGPWYIPAVQFNAVNSPSPSFSSVATANVVAGTPFSFTITTTGVPVPTLSMIGRKLPKGLTFHNNGDGTATISGTATTRNINKNYTVVIKARNARNSSAKQRLTLTLTGGRA
jgi:hypothetical protein